jgi:PAS domain S-box-containing protein
MKLYGIERQTMLVTLIPILMMAALLESYFIYARFSDIDRALLERSQMMAHQIAYSSEYAVFSGNQELLQQNVDDALAQPDVSKLVVMDTDAKPLAGKALGPFLLAKVNSSNLIFQDKDALVLYEPILATQIKFDNFSGESLTQPSALKPLGAVVIEISKHRLNQMKREIFLLGFLFTGLILAGALMLAIWASRRLTRPVMEMSDAIQRFGKGELDTRISSQAKVFELNVLANGFNQMASQLQHEHEILEDLVASRIAALAASEREYRSLFENAPDAIARYDHECRCIYANPAFGNLVEGGVKALLGKKPSELPGEFSSEFYETQIKDVFASGQNAQLDLTWLGKAGNKICSQIRLTAERDLSGNIRSVLGVGREITTLKLAERILNDQNLEMIALRDEALAASQSKSEFLANMSHEIRTPMNSILGMAHLALTIELPPKAKNYLEKIHLSGLSLLGIIDEILDISKIGAGKLRLENNDFDLVELLDNSKILFEEKIRGKRLSFSVDIDRDIPTRLHGDAPRLGQVLINYIGNAVKFTARGAIAVSVKKVDENSCGVLLRFEVQDSGIGISEVTKSKLFKPFQQADSSTTREYGGTGLGLAISRKLVELMPEGEVGVESVLGQGSTFWFSTRLGLPVSEADETLVETDTRPDYFEKLKGTRILLADDHPLNLEVAGDILENAGVIVSTAKNGKEVLELLKRNHFDCVLMDIQMPVMDGFEATRLIRLDPVLAEILVIAMTANASKEDCERCLKSGMDDYITKPFKPAQFYATLAKWLEKHATGNKRRAEANEVFPKVSSPEFCPIDFTVLTELFGDDKQKMREMIGKFMESSRLDMKKIDAALKLKDYTATSKLAHFVRGPSGMIGAMGLAKLCIELEVHCVSGDKENRAQEVIGKMHTMLDRINEQMDKYFP